MSVRYHVIERHNPRDMTAPKKFYPMLKTSGRTRTRQLALDMSERSTVSIGDMLVTLEGMLSTIPKELANGNIVDLGEFGTFKLQVKTDGASSADEITSKHIHHVSVRFSPGKAFKDALGKIEFVKE